MFGRSHYCRNPWGAWRGVAGCRASQVAGTGGSRGRAADSWGFSLVRGRRRRSQDATMSSLFPGLDGEELRTAILQMYGDDDGVEHLKTEFGGIKWFQAGRQR